MTSLFFLESHAAELKRTQETVKYKLDIGRTLKYKQDTNKI